MAVGDVKSGLLTINQNSIGNLQPPSGEEWVIHNIMWSNSLEFRRTDGTNIITYDSDTTAGARLGVSFHLTNGQYIAIRNMYAGTLYFAYDGVQTK